MTYCHFGPAREHDAPHLIEDGRCVDAAITLGRGKRAVSARLVMIPGPDGYLSYLTDLARASHGPHQVGELYRVRWEIKSDNKLGKSGSRLDQIRATTETSVGIILCAALLHSMVVDLLIHRDNLERKKCGTVLDPQPPIEPPSLDEQYR